MEKEPIELGLEGKVGIEGRLRTALSTPRSRLVASEKVNYIIDPEVMRKRHKRVQQEIDSGGGCQTQGSETSGGDLVDLIIIHRDLWMGYKSRPLPNLSSFRVSLCFLILI